MKNERKKHVRGVFKVLKEAIKLDNPIVLLAKGEKQTIIFVAGNRMSSMEMIDECMSKSPELTALLHTVTDAGSLFDKLCDLKKDREIPNFDRIKDIIDKMSPDEIPDGLVDSHDCETCPVKGKCPIEEHVMLIKAKKNGQPKSEKEEKAEEKKK